MPYTVPASFSKFYENINLPGNHQQTSTARRDRVVSLLGNEFEILDAFPTGSIPKKTAVKGYADLDVMVVLHFSKHIKGKRPSEVLQDVRDALAEYRTGARKNGQAVTLYYETWPNVDIVPVSRTTNDDGSVSHYNVPDMNREEWLVSRPRLHESHVASMVESFGPEFRRIIKMIKWWNHKHSEYLQSYHIEVLALKILKGRFSNYPSEIRSFFDEAYTLVSSSMWHDGGIVDEYLTWEDRQEALKRLATAKSKALDAWYATYDKNDDHKKAIELWRQIFGGEFPTYGS